jgi:hypothetical protein
MRKLFRGRRCLPVIWVVLAQLSDAFMDLNESFQTTETDTTAEFDTLSNTTTDDQDFEIVAFYSAFLYLGRNGLTVSVLKLEGRESPPPRKPIRITRKMCSFQNRRDRVRSKELWLT